jgi:hypothetical protein
VEVLERVSVVDQLLEDGDDLREDLVDEDDEAAVEAGLVVPDQSLPRVPLGVPGVVERCLPREL